MACQGECIFQYVNAGLRLAEFIGMVCYQTIYVLCNIHISLSPSILYASMGCLRRSAGFISCFEDCTAYVLVISRICAQLLDCELDYIWICVLLSYYFEMCSMYIVHDMRFQQNACNNTIMQWALDQSISSVMQPEDFIIIPF